MALYTKQDFCPPIFSRRWLAMKFRPNMIIYNRHHILSILESGLLFREDSIEVEQETPSAEDVWAAAGVGRGGWLTRGEGSVALLAVGGCVAAFPPKSANREALIKLGLYITLPIAVRAFLRAMAGSCLGALLLAMRDYLALARRAHACLKEYKALHVKLDSISSVIDSTYMLLCRQQSELCVLMSRTSSALLGNAPWLRGDVAWEAAGDCNADDLMKIHHAYLVVQSTFLKHIAMAHFIPSKRSQTIYKNYNERIYWIHNSLLKHLVQEFKENYESLERMYRLLRNIGNNDVNTNKKLGKTIVDSWLYSDVHNGIARTSLELKLAANKCNALDVLLDSCAMNKQELEISVLEKDVDDLIDSITKCLSTVHNSQIRLRKIKGKVEGVSKEVVVDEIDVIDDYNVVIINNKPQEAKDEVFYFVKTEDDVQNQLAVDVTTGPGKKEKETTKIVLNELKQKLGKREDVMRERERQALVKTMPEYKDDVPEFPRQIKLEEFIISKGFISKLNNRNRKSKKLFLKYKIVRPKKNKAYAMKIEKYDSDKEISKPYYEANAKLNVKSRFISIASVNKQLVITKWYKGSPQTNSHSGLDFSWLSNGLTAEERVYKFCKRDLELSESSSDSDFEFYREKQLAILKDARKHRAMRRKNYPKKPSLDKDDESLKPIEYSFGTGLAMASVLQVNNNVRLPGLAAEEVFIGDGEVSNDSGNDEDA